MPPLSPVRILFVGDMHLGRRASRVPPAAWQDHGLDPEVLTPVSAWRRTVDTALAHGVDAVALAGDLVHQEDDVFEARGHLEDGIRRLTTAGVRVCAIAGNHDTLVMPVLAEVIPELDLLGPGGTWTCCDVTPEVRLVGWSFPARHHPSSPLETAPPAPVTGVVSLGLLHGDLDVAGSPYAPVSSAELLARGYDGWALGHVHAPDPVPSPGHRYPFYLGSVSATTPNETGAHGPVLATIADGAVTWRRLPLAPLRWEHREVPVDDLTAGDGPLAGALRGHLLRALTGLDLPGADPALPPDLLGLRLTLTGAHARADAIARAAAGFDRGDLITRDPTGTVVFVEKITAAATMPVDLPRLAEREDPPGLLARQILALETGDPGIAPLLVQARLAAGQVTLPDDPDNPDSHDDPLHDDEALRRELVAAGRRALNALLGQQGDARP